MLKKALANNMPADAQNDNDNDSIHYLTYAN